MAAMATMATTAAVRVLRLQGAYYLVTGVWPLVHMKSFLAVTGPKEDLWLVRTVAVLITMCAIAILIAARARRVTPEIVMLASGCALSLAAVDVTYVLRGTISPIYLADAVVELILAPWLLTAAMAAWRRGPA